MSTSPFRPEAPGTGDRETLSALIDGELHGDAVRFAMKRLGHDAEWRATAGRWQLIGDVLRGQQVAIARGDFAARVGERIAREAAATPVRPRRAGRWAVGGALAASVALAAWIGLRPQTGPAPAAPLATVPARPTVPAPAASGPETPVGAPRTAQRPAAAAAPQVASATSAAPVERRAAPSRRRGAQTREDGNASLLASAPTRASSASNPFNAPPVEPAARPWPRSRLPLAGEGAMNARFVEPSPFYPFEPRLPEQPATELPAPPY